MKKPSIEELSQKRILVLDGAMGTMIQKHKLEEEDFRGERFKDFQHSLQGNSDLLCLTQAKIIQDIHRSFLEAGADILETNTFSANKFSLADYHMEDLVDEINYEGARMAREVADEYTEKNPDKPRYVAGSIGPTTKTASLSPDVNNPGYRAVTFEDLRKTYKDQAEALLRGGADILLVETVFDTLNAKAALFAIMEIFDEQDIEVPVMISGTITDASGRTLSGQTAEAFLTSISHAPLFSVGLNCALGAKQLRPYVQTLAKEAPFAVSAHPNAGLPNAFGEYDQDADEMAELIKEYLDLNLVNVIGGCCGTTPEHIKAIADLAAQYEPRKLPEAEPAE